MATFVPEGSRRRIVVGIDTHKHIHVAVALDAIGGRLGELTFPVTVDGYVQLEQWACGLGHVDAFGVEGTGSYGAGLSRFLRRRGYPVFEVNRPDRRIRRQRGKTDAVDAENAARAALNGQATAVPKSGERHVEMIRHIKIARDTAVKARTQAMVTLKALLVSIPEELRSQLEAVTGPRALIARCAGLRVDAVASPTESAKHALRLLARRWLELDNEVKAHDQELTRITAEHAPALVGAFGIGATTAAEILLVVGDNAERIRSEAAFAKLCGVCPVPASSGKIIRYRLNRGGHRQANAALHRLAILRMRFHLPSIEYARRRAADGKTKAEIIRCLKRYVAREIFHLVKPRVSADPLPVRLS